MKMILTVLKLKSDHDFRRKNSKGAYVRKNVGAVMFFFFSAYRLMVVYICTKFHKNFLGGIIVIEQTRYVRNKFKEELLRKNVGGVTMSWVRSWT